MHLQALILGKVHANALFFVVTKSKSAHVFTILLIQEVKKNANI